MRHCPKYKINVDNSECIHCEWNMPVTFSLTTNCKHTIQLIWNSNYKEIIKFGEVE